METCTKANVLKEQSSMKIDGSSNSGHLGLGQFVLTLGRCNGPNHHAEHSLGNDIRDGVTNLLGTGCESTAQSNHLDDVDTWVSAPGDRSQIASLHDESPGSHRLLLSRSGEANHQGHDD